MDIYTGYYAQMKKYVQADLVPVSIAYLMPVWYMGETCFELAPPRQLLKKYKDGILTPEGYTEEYKVFLDNEVKWSKVLKKLRGISSKHKGKDLVLCCYEKPEDFCHRHILAEYLTDTGIDVQEWVVKKC